MTDTTPTARAGQDGPSGQAAHAGGVRAALVELMHFTQKEARACLFAGLFFLSVLLVPRAGLLGLYARATVVFRPHRQDRRMPLALGLVLVGFFIWLAENIGTFFGLWAYPHQLGAWATVHMSKWSAWSLLVLMSFTIVTNLKHVKATVHVPE